MAKQKKKYRFRLNSGGYIHTEWVDVTPEDREKGGRFIHREDPITGKKTLQRMVKTRYEAGDIIETNVNLAEVFGNDCTANGTRKPRFEEIKDVPEYIPTHDFEARRKILKKVPVDGLRQLAEEEEIDLGNVTKKDDIIEAILHAQAAVTA